MIVESGDGDGDINGQGGDKGRGDVDKDVDLLARFFGAADDKDKATNASASRASTVPMAASTFLSQMRITTPTGTRNFSTSVLFSSSATSVPAR